MIGRHGLGVSGAGTGGGFWFRLVCWGADISSTNSMRVTAGDCPNWSGSSTALDESMNSSRTSNPFLLFAVVFLFLCFVLLLIVVGRWADCRLISRTSRGFPTPPLCRTRCTTCGPGFRRIWTSRIWRRSWCRGRGNPARSPARRNLSCGTDLKFWVCPMQCAFFLLYLSPFLFPVAVQTCKFTCLVRHMLSLLLI